MKLYSYICLSCRGEISHSVATRLLVEKTLLPLAERQESHSQEGSDEISHDDKRAFMLESLHQQAFAPARSWLNKSKEKGLIDKGIFTNFVSMLNRGKIECPKCRAKGNYKWNNSP